MTPEELQEVVAAVIAALKTNGKTIDQLTAVTSLANSDNLEVSGGKKISFGKLKEIVAADVTVSAEEIKGYVVIESTDDLPEEPTAEQRMKGYLLGTTLYVYVGTGGDTLGGKYLSAELKGPQGNPGVNLGYAEIVNDLVTGGATKVLSAEQGKELYVLTQGPAREIKKSDFVSGKWYNNSNYSIGDTMPVLPTTDTAGLYCIRLAIEKGDVFRVYTKGSFNAYAWTLLDANNKILSTCGSNKDYTTTPATVTASQDGYVIVQHNNNQHPVDADTVLLSVYDVLKGVENLDDRVTVIEGKVADPVTETYTTDDYHIEDDSNNCYWQTATIGTTITTATKVAVQGVVFRCLEPIQVYAGDRIQVKVLGGGNGRAWALTDTNRKILSNAAASADGRTTPLETTATQDGWLYVSLNGGSGLPASGSTLAAVKRGIFALADETYTKNEVDAMVGKRKMRILSVGNSYSMDALSYLPEIAKLYSPNVEVTIGILYYAGATIGEHYAGLTYELLLYKDGAWTSQASKTLEYAVGLEDWDLVTLHQASQYSDNYASRYFVGRTSTAGQDDLLLGLINKIKGYGYSGQFGWLMTPAYPAGNTSDLGNTQDAMMDGIIDFAENVMANYTDMKVLLPCGDALMRARKSTQFEGITNEFFYTDNLHLNRGIGAYIEACAVYEVLLGFNGGCQLQTNLAWAKEAYAHGTETGMTLNNESGAISVAMDAVLEPYSYINIQGGGVQSDWNVIDTSSMAYIKNKPTIPAACPIIEDTRTRAVAAITGVAPFAELVNGQRILLHFNQNSGSNSVLNLTLSGGTSTGPIPIKISSYRQTEINLGPQFYRTNDYAELIYVESRNVWSVIGQLDTNTTYTWLQDSFIKLGTSTEACYVRAIEMHDNMFIVEIPYTSSVTALKANKIYDFGTVSSALTIPSLDATNDLVSNALNFYALRFISGTDNLSITFPTGVQKDAEPTINTGDYVEIMINKYGSNFYASIKVWPAQ